MLVFKRPAKVYDSEKEGWEALLNDEIVAGGVVVIRYQVPNSSPGMSHLETFIPAVCENELERDILLITDGRFSGATRGLAIAYLSL